MPSRFDKPTRIAVSSRHMMMPGAWYVHGSGIMT